MGDPPSDKRKTRGRKKVAGAKLKTEKYEVGENNSYSIILRRKEE